jgi:hypothetical protein
MEKWSFLYFKESGKYYTAGQGNMTEHCFDLWSRRASEGDLGPFLDELCRLNDGHLPGLSGARTDLAMVMMGTKEDGPFGWPVLFTAGRLSSQ